MTDANPEQTAVGACRLQAVCSGFPTVHAGPEIRLQKDRQPE
jgi:hypothetical protein